MYSSNFQIQFVKFWKSTDIITDPKNDHDVQRHDPVMNNRSVPQCLQFYQSLVAESRMGGGSAVFLS